MLSRNTTPLSWRAHSSRTSMTLKLMPDEKEFLRTVTYVAAFPLALGPHAAKLLANNIASFIHHSKPGERERLLERCRAASLLPDEHGRMSELETLAATLRSCIGRDNDFRVVLK